MQKAAVAAVVVWSLFQTPGRAANLADLTIPGGVLPAGCALSPAPSQRLQGDRFRSGLWAGLPMPTNPWVGTDAPVIASIVERLQPATVIPDGPPQAPGEAARYRLHLADGIEQAYAAVYQTRESGEIAEVYAVRFTNNEAAREFAKHAAPAVALNIVVTGPVAIATMGGATTCQRAIREYLSRLPR